VGAVATKPCDGLAALDRLGIPTAVVSGPDRVATSDAISAAATAMGARWLLLGFDRILAGGILETFQDRIVNIHPSILPAFTGMAGWDQAMAAGARFIGSTLHLIDERLDAGMVIGQTSRPLDPTADRDEVRHALFEQQVRLVVQVVRWIDQERLIVVDGRVVVHGASYDDPWCSPALDPDLAAWPVPDLRGR
jgi:phosphoribosylglycinamide formyltransferase 1